MGERGIKLNSKTGIGVGKMVRKSIPSRETVLRASKLAVSPLPKEGRVLYSVTRACTDPETRGHGFRVRQTIPHAAEGYTRDAHVLTSLPPLRLQVAATHTQLTATGGTRHCIPA